MNTQPSTTCKLFKTATHFLFTISCIVLSVNQLSALDTWPQFRGPTGDGIAMDQSPPTALGEDQNLVWKTKLPGRAWSSPVVAGGVVWMTTAIERVPENDDERIELLRQTDSREEKFNQMAIAKAIELKVLAVDFASGELIKTINLVNIENPDAIHSLNSYASPTPVIDGDRLYCHFGTFGTFALNRETGQIAWQRKLPLKHGVGPGSSPLIDGERLILIQDGLERQYVTALDKRNGKTLWETDRPPMDAPSGDQKKAYSTPIVATDSSGREQVICMGSQWMVSYDPENGDELWRVYHGKGFSVIPRPVIHDNIVYFSTGYGKPELWAVNIDGSGDVTDTHVQWRVKKGIPAKPSPLLFDGLVYVVADNGVASCLDIDDGHEIWKKRLGGNFSASPILAGGSLYFANHEGEVFVMTAGADAKLVATNQLDGQIMASPAVIDNSLILRTDRALYRFQ